MQADTVILSPRERATLLGVLAPFADRLERVAVFGSRVLGRARPASDIDLALYGEISDREAARIWSLFNASSLAVTVDVVRYAGLGSGPFRRHIDRYARTLFTQENLIAAQVSQAA